MGVIKVRYLDGPLAKTVVPYSLPYESSEEFLGKAIVWRPKQGTPMLYRITEVLGKGLVGAKLRDG